MARRIESHTSPPRSQKREQASSYIPGWLGCGEMASDATERTWVTAFLQEMYDHSWNNAVADAKKNNTET